GLARGGAGSDDRVRRARPLSRAQVLQEHRRQVRKGGAEVIDDFWASVLVLVIMVALAPIVIVVPLVVSAVGALLPSLIQVAICYPFAALGRQHKREEE